ncbi:MAG: DNA gyrase/topoisomerase IV subunit A [Bacteroidetes bacterium]|uniref:DNA gyrase/topoisomerase IV subunit A n=1 Tax=Phaeocystidibacter marisrubri TaxID=1577780 RepID=A0A6L3ZI64_9FLAO|nr:DNA gyrase/topoisomerase IV subunit A [Phaeocystidibacter marisrubri]KAB2817313.1 DNA gyrase/topoisomerase IV subunit A [Phaeocystidibacter marisrubri]TNE29826.1 MAG: DNA gyrase/topoisomerase IV subunit A [Bacteroidota bacterium]GGH75972.1 DNA topoisomerase IV subunit A [Phaeocystidibacter marisrubri]
MTIENEDGRDLNEELNGGGELENQEELQDEDSSDKVTVSKVSGMYEDYFLDYASYVILERAVPSLEDGFKPVQRRLLHALRELDDGRFHKVANVIGHTMKYHPHGDASIGDALVQLGQKDILVDTQGNWGNILTGDNAAAPRYIEARLSKFALEVVFNPKITDWQLSYDGRAKEPIHLPVKFPLLLAQGVEGIAVGLSTRVLPHNFVELIDASIKILRGKKVEVLPDFPTGGIADFTQYNDGIRGGKVRIRAKISQLDKKTLVITEIPFGTTTQSLIDSIVKANEKGKIKIKKIEDNTAEHVEIVIHLPANISPDKTIDALYAFTSCENSVSPLCCIIENDRPLFIGVSELLRRSTEHTLELLKAELEINLKELQESWHFASLEKIFIENKIYREIEEAETWEEVIGNIRRGLEPFIKHLLRPVTEEDIVRLTEIRIKRISKFDSTKADEHIVILEGRIEEIKNKLANLVDYAVDYFKNLKKKYSEGRERKTEIRVFDEIVATKVAIANEKLYVNREEGFIGTSLKKDEYVCDCSDIDDIIIFRRDGVMSVTKVDTKTYVGKDIIHVAVFKKGDKRTVYNMIYRDGGPKGKAMMKRFNVTSVTRDKEYDLTAGTKGSEVMYFTANPNGEAEVVTVHLKALQRLKKLKFDLDFSDLAIKGRNAKGNIASKYPVRKIELKEEGVSTLAPRRVWYDDTVQRLNYDGRGQLLGAFRGDNKILTILSSGHYRLTSFDVSTHFDEDMILMEKWRPDQPITAVYYDGAKDRYYVKRFLIEVVNGEKNLFISDADGSRLELVSTSDEPSIEVIFKKVKGKERDPETTNLAEFISVKGWKALGNQLTPHPVKVINLLPDPEPEEVEEEEVDEADENTNTNEPSHSNSSADDDGPAQITLEF